MAEADNAERSEVQRDIVTAGPLARLAALLDRGAPSGREVPALGHWLFTLPDARQSALGVDGHPIGTGLVPNPPAPRRMWAGSRILFPGTLIVGDAIERRSSVASTTPKGAMSFVTLRHEIVARGAVCVIEEQDIVYLPARRSDDVAAPAKPVAIPEATSTRRMTADSALLFRFSALTFNAHRIHFDRDYARDVEHYPGLVVHGPLLATLLVDHARRGASKARVTAFDFRVRAPVFDGEAFDLCRNGDDLWVCKADGSIAMTACISFA